MHEDEVVQICHAAPRPLSMFKFAGVAKSCLGSGEESSCVESRSNSRGFSERRHIAPSHMVLPSTTVSVCTTTTRCCLIAISLVTTHCRRPIALLNRGFKVLPIGYSL